MQVERFIADRLWVVLEDGTEVELFSVASICDFFGDFFGLPTPHVPGDTTTPPAPDAIQIGPTDIS